MKFKIIIQRQGEGWRVLRRGGVTLTFPDRERACRYAERRLRACRGVIVKTDVASIPGMPDFPWADAFTFIT